MREFAREILERNETVYANTGTGKHPVIGSRFRHDTLYYSLALDRETNILSLHGRGVVVCLGCPDLARLALAAGNAVVLCGVDPLVAGDVAPSQWIATLSSAAFAAIRPTSFGVKTLPRPRLWVFSTTIKRVGEVCRESRR